MLKSIFTKIGLWLLDRAKYQIPVIKPIVVDIPNNAVKYRASKMVSYGDYGMNPKFHDDCNPALIKTEMAGKISENLVIDRNETPYGILYSCECYLLQVPKIEY